MVERIASLAAKMGLSPVAAIALPTTLDCAGQSLGLSRAQLVAHCETNAPLRDYLATVCREAMAS